MEFNYILELLFVSAINLTYKSVIIYLLVRVQAVSFNSKLLIVNKIHLVMQ